MARVLKYPFKIHILIDILMPVDAHVVHVAMQGEVPCMWAEVTDGPQEWRQFQLFGTGHKIPEGLRHVATFQMPPFVWHLYEGGKLSHGYH